MYEYRCKVVKVIDGDTVDVDIDLGFGRLRLKSGSSDGGHNGIKSINSYLQSNEYFRLKVGVGRPPKEVNPADFVYLGFIIMKKKKLNF